MTEPSNTVDPKREDTLSDPEPQPREDEVATGGPESASSRDERRDERTRTRLRDAEAERDRYRNALTPHIRSAVESQIETRVAEPAALWLLPDLDPMSLLDNDFGIDAEKLDAAVEQLRERLPRLGRRFLGSADGGVGTPSPQRDSATWANVIKP